MMDKPGSELDSRMEAGWELREGDEVREALALAMEILWRDLYQMLDTLEAIQESLPRDEKTADQELNENEIAWSESLSPILH